MTNADQYREVWLHRASDRITEWFAEIGATVPPVRLSVGWPSRGGLGKKKRVVGECWESEGSEDGINQIFISPVRGAEQSVEALTTLVHELVHAVDDCQNAHKGPFIDIAKKIGLVRPWTATTASPELHERLTALIEEIGPMPSGAIRTDGGGVDSPKKQSARMIKVYCANGDGGKKFYSARTTRKWLEEYGAPICPCCQVTMEIEEKED